MRSTRFLAGMAIGCWLVFTGPARAAGGGEHKPVDVYKVHTVDDNGKEVEVKLDREAAAKLVAAGKAHSVAEEKPLNPLAWSWDLGLWTLVVFVLLLLVLRKLAWKPMLEGLKKREDSIAAALDEAKLARQEAAQLQSRYQDEMNKAAEKVREILEEARRDAQATSDEMVTKARSEIGTERDRLRREIDTAKDQALKQLWTESAQLATLISAKAIRRGLSEEDHRRLVDEAIADLKTAGADRHEQRVR